MIISASRRTDIPAFFSEWFFKRMNEGVVLVRNPMNPRQVSRIQLHPQWIDCIVFWTKNPENMMHHLSQLNDYQYYFQFTLTPYDKSIEINVPEKNRVIDTFIRLSQRIGKERVIWRYDPILITKEIDLQYHFWWFECLAEKLYTYTEKCIISFLDLYAKTERGLKAYQLLPITNETMREIATAFSRIASKYHIQVETCSELIDLSEYGIKHSSCIDDKLISRILGHTVTPGKDPNQRECCGCAKSIDIGAYNTCKHHCLYCYANFSKKLVDRNCLLNNPDSPLLS